MAASMFPFFSATRASSCRATVQPGRNRSISCRSVSASCNFGSSAPVALVASRRARKKRHCVPAFSFDPLQQLLRSFDGRPVGKVGRQLGKLADRSHIGVG